MANEDLIKALRECGYCNVCSIAVDGDCPFGGRDALEVAAADALGAAEQRIAKLEDDLRDGTISNPERFRIYDYSVRDLILFADICKRNNVSEDDLKQAAWNLELAVRAVVNERLEIVKNTVDEIKMMFTPDFEKTFAEMRGEHDEHE